MKSLQSEFEKAAESSEKRARAEQDRLAENCSEYRKLVAEERHEKRESGRQNRKAIAELCENLEVAMSQQSELQNEVATEVQANRGDI